MLNNFNDILVAQFKAAFVLSDFQSGLVQFAFYIGYFLFAIPASLIMGRFGYKTAIIFGLTLIVAGALMFEVAAHTLLYMSFLIALFVLAIGCSFLETSANPYISLIGGEDSVRYLNFAQSFNALGAITAVVIGKFFILSKINTLFSQGSSSFDSTHLAKTHVAAIHQIVDPYIGIAIVAGIVGIIIFATKYPSIKTSGSLTLKGYVLSMQSLLKNMHFLRGVLAQFMYVGAQTCVWSYTLRYCMYMHGMAPTVAANYLLASLIAFACGRFFTTAILKFVSPRHLMGLYGIINTVLCLYIVFFTNIEALWALVLISFFMSMMYPTIFTLSIARLGKEVPYASSIIVMSILGGALITIVMGAVSDASSIADAFIIPSICFLYIAGYSLFGSQSSRLHAN